MQKNKALNLLFVSFLLFFSGMAYSSNIKKPKLKKVRVLVYTKNGEGYVHDNIPSAVAGLQALSEAHGFKMDVSDDPSIFTKENLDKYTMLIFSSTNNDVFDTDDQRLAFRRYIQAGGTFLGIHSVTGTERNWAWFKQLIGGTFLWHPRYQEFMVRMVKEHPSVAGLPKEWKVKDECYFTKEIYPGIEVLMAHDLSSLDPKESEKIQQSSGSFGNLYPAVWHQQFDGGNMWLTTLGHSKEKYQDPVFMQHILQGIEFLVSVSKKLDYSKVYAVSKDDPVRY